MDGATADDNGAAGKGGVGGGVAEGGGQRKPES